MLGQHCGRGPATRDAYGPRVTIQILNSLLPAEGRVAWTLDDGTDPESIRRYALYAAESGVRLTIFPVGSYPGWTEHADLWRPLIQSGQVQVGNHTWSHIELPALTDDEIVADLERNETWIQDLWDVSTKPYFRPPNGPHDERTDAVVEALGWTKMAMWSGLLAEGPTRTAEELVASAAEEFVEGAIVIGHANFEPIREALPDVNAALIANGVAAVTLRDVYGD